MLFRSEQEAGPGCDPQSEAINFIGQWLSTLPTQDQQFRVLTYWIWRLKSGDDPKKIYNWVTSFAEQSTVEIAGRTGF